MADTKISAMTGAGEVKNADLLPIVQGGANFSANRALLLAAAAGEVIAMSGALGQEVRSITGSGNADMRLHDMGGSAKLRGTTSQVSNIAETIGLFVTATGVQILAPNGMVPTCFIGITGFSSVTFDPAAGTVVFVAAGGMTCPYIDGTAGAWTGMPPANYNVAIDRLATAIRAMGWAGML